MIVAKIGGSCLSSEDGIRRTIEYVKEWKKEKERPIIVVSALKGITDELLKQAENALTGHFDLENIKDQHYTSLKGLTSIINERTKKRLDILLNELKESILRVTDLHELRPNDRDEIVAYGEKMATEIVAAYLTNSGIKAKPLWDRDAGIITNSNFGNASILDQSVPLIKSKLDTTYIPVVAGFFGKDEDGKIATLGRGGSDYTATFISAALGCPVTLFKDVDGLMTADPKVIETASVIDEINYLDALELARYGAKVISEKAVIPAMEAQIPIKITNFFKSSEGTTICNEGEANAISSIPEVVKINVNISSEKLNMLSCILSEFDALDINPLLLSKVSRCGFSIVVKQSEADLIQSTIRKVDQNANIEKEMGIGMVAALGSNVREEGIYSLSKLLVNNKIKINTINKSANSKILCIIVDKQYLEPTIRLLHNRFIESSQT